MNLTTELQRRLKDGGWSLARHGGSHNVWTHPNGATYPLPHRLRETAHMKANCLKSIEAKERTTK